MLFKLFLAVITACFMCDSQSAVTYKNLHNFSGGTDGYEPIYNLVRCSNTLYGMTYEGGSNGIGTVFAIGTNGTGFTNLYSFKGGTDGDYPYGGLTLSGDTLYGMTYEGGSKNLGTVFTIKTDGSEYKVLYSFGTGTNDGAFPYGSLILSGGTLYGTTYEGGQSNTGTVFAIGTNGTGYTNLYSFKGGTDGQNPPDGLALGGSILYGTTYEGGADGYGSVFSISTNGTNYSILHSFTGGSDGAYPYTKVFVSGKNLYGTTYEGGADDYGTLFTLKTTGKGFKVLHKFTDGPDGAYPANGVVVAGGKVYGMTYEGGIGGYGNIFDVSTAGSGFKVLHDFGSGTTNSAYPYQNTLILSGSILYGTTYYGGTASGDGYGTIFSLDLR